MDKNEKHERIKRTLKIVGPIVAAAGLILTVIGLASFFSAFGGSGTPKLFWCAFVGLPLFGFGLMIAITAFRREIATYHKNESVPVINEAAEETKPAARAIAAALQEGFQADSAQKACTVCGKQNDAGAKFCNNCGARLKKTCPSCGGENDGGAKFCDQCGASLDN